MANLSTYVPFVQNEVDDSSARAQAIIERALIETYQEIIRHCGKFLVGTSTYSVTVTPSTANYMPTAFTSIEAVLYKGATDTDYHELTQITEQEYISHYYNSDAGSPQFYYHNGNDINIVPAPVDAGTLEVLYVPVQNELSVTQTSIIPDRYQNVMVLGGIARFKMYEGTPEATEYQASFVSALNGMERDYKTRFAVVKPKFFGL